jgi:hypothetical protein
MRFKIVACILCILSVFSFVLAAPVPVREVREACADAVEGGENVIIVSGKRAPRGDPYEGTEEDLYPTDLYSPDSPDTELGTSPSQSPSPPDHASGSHSTVDMPSSPSPSSGGDSSPGWFSKVWSIPGETKVSSDPEGAFKPGTTTENEPASSSKTKKVNFWHTTKVHIFEPDLPDEDQPASLPPHSETKSVSWGLSNKVVLPSGEVISEPLPPPEVEPLPLPPGREGYLAKVSTKQQSPSPEIEHASPSSYFDLPQPQSKGFVSNFKTFFGKLGKLNFRPRFQRAVDTGA